MNIITLKELFAGARPKLHSAEITWEGNTATLYFQRLSLMEAADLLQPFIREGRDGIPKEDFKRYQAALMAATLRDADGKTVIAADDIFTWDSEFFALVNKEVSRQNPTIANMEDVAKNSETTPASTS